MDVNQRIIEQVKLLCTEMPIKDNVVCLLHYGSIKQKEDFNKNSDLDFHLVLKEIKENTLDEIKDIFGFSSKIDLSIHSIDEVTKNNKIYFQNGNQGLYFMHILASSEVLVGKNIYINLIEKIDKNKSDNSIIEKMRYYIWNLRNNYISGNNNLNFYKKYFIRILMDILIMDNKINYKNISKFNNRNIVNLYIKKYEKTLKKDELKMLVELINLDKLKNPNLKKYIILFSKIINEILWKN